MFETWSRERWTKHMGRCLKRIYVKISDPIMGQLWQLIIYNDLKVLKITKTLRALWLVDNWIILSAAIICKLIDHLFYCSWVTTPVNQQRVTAVVHCLSEQCRSFLLRSSSLTDCQKKCITSHLGKWLLSHIIPLKTLLCDSLYQCFFLLNHVLSYLIPKLKNPTDLFR